MRPKHILVPLIMSLAIFSFNPNLASAEIETINKEQQTEEAELIEEEQNKADEVEKVETNEVEENLLENIDSVKDNEKSNKNSNSKENNSQHKSKELNKTTKAETVSTNSINLSEQDIIQLKKNLTLLGFGNFPTNPSSVYGPVTSGVVKEFQQYFGLKVTGEVDANTLDKINEILNPPYKIGHRGLHIVELKNKLSKLGFGNFPNDPSIFYGSVTATVVKDFQKAYRLQADGIANKDTLNKLDEIIQHSLKIGDKNEQVRELKKNLTQLGFGNFPNSPSTTYGKVTANVVKDFQKYYDLNVTGVADVNTLQKIKEVLEPPYKDGDRGLHIKELKENLTALGFGNFPQNPSIFYGTVTANVVKEFQETYGITADGIADKSTLNKVNELLKSVLKAGDKNQKVRQLKKDLTQLGFGNFPNNPSTTYGKVTANVVKEFQRYYKLDVTGIADANTLQKIKEVLEPPYKDGDRGLHIKELKENLTTLGFGNFPQNPSIFYGTVTANVVKTFQKSYELKATGIANKETLSKIEELLNPPFTIGDKGTHIRDLKQNLSKLGFGNFPNNPSINYGTVTANVVKDFQKFLNIEPTGVIDETTYDLIMNGFKNNKKGSHVVALKKHLTKLGFGSFPSSPSTTYGNVTTKVVKEFQAYYGISRTGNVGLNTLKALNENVNSLYQNGKRGSHIVKLKKDLRNIGFGNFPKNPSNKFGSVTEKVVKDFQRAFGLKVNGIMDSVSLKVLKQQQSKVRIVIDAGHGGHDPGATANGLREKDLTLYIAKEIEKQLKKYKNVEIKMVRSRDEYLALQERSKLANGWKADFYFSVHINAGGGTGIESYVHNNASRDAINKQSIIHDHLLNGLRGDKVRDRGKKKANFHVLRETNMSAMLVEYLFIDNITDANKLKNNAFKKKLARLTAEGIAKAFNLRK